MRITIFGGKGNLGSRIVEEAVMQGHDVMVVARDESRFNSLPAAVDARVGDVNVVSEVASLSDGQDLAVALLDGAEMPRHSGERFTVACG